METTYTVTVGEDKAGARLDRVLAEALPGLSRTRLQALIRERRVAPVRGGPLSDPAYRIEGGSIWTISVPPSIPPAPEPQDIPLDIVFEDEDVIVIDKPAGMVVHPAAGRSDGTVVNALLGHCGGALSRGGGPSRPGIVHRLDKDTSGLMVAAKSDRAYFALVGQFAQHSVERAYYAVVWGIPGRPRGRVAMSIGRSPADRKKMSVVAVAGKPAATEYRIVRTFAKVASLVECRPLTGRTHQIRVHMAALGHPLVGDSVYGRRAGRLGGDVDRGSALGSFPRHALHAYLIGFAHPRDQTVHRFVSQVQNDMSKLVEFLETL